MKNFVGTLLMSVALQLCCGIATVNAEQLQAEVVQQSPAAIVQPYQPRTTFAAFAAVEPLWAHSEFEFRGGDSGERLQGRIFVPLLQDEDEIFFTDIRGQFNDFGGAEGNFGLAYRQNFGEWIGGVYGFYDVKDSPNNNTFQQAAFGAELMSEVWDFRINGYVPDRDVKYTGAATASVSGGRVMVQAEEERAYYGLDAEAGALLYATEGEFDVELRAFAGFFHFDNDTAGFENATGPRLRAELRMFDLALLGVNSRVIFGGMYEYDDVRGNVGTGMLAVRIPFGRAANNMSRLRRRMTDTIVRDIDIVTQSAAGALEAAVSASTGQAIGQVTVVDANTENPTATVAAAGDGSTVIVDGSKGQINTATPIAAQTGQTIRGGGFQVRGARSGVSVTVGNRPTVNGTDANQNVIITAGNSTIRDLNITGGKVGIASDATDTPAVDLVGVTLLNNQISSGDHGIAFGDADGNTTIANNTVKGHTVLGFRFFDNNGVIKGNIATGNVVGVSFGANNGTFTGNTAIGSGMGGFMVVSNAGLFSGNVSNNNGANGFLSFTNTGTFTGNTASGNVQHGFSFLSNDATFTGNVSSLNGGDGFSNFGGNFTNNAGGTFSNNIATGNADMGFRGVNNGVANENNTGGGADNINGGNTFP